MRLVVLTTSYPLTSGSSSGIFVARLVEHLPPDAAVTVVTPAPRGIVAPRTSDKAALATFRYAPKALQILAHEPGGIPVALRTHKWAYLLVPPFLLSMFVRSLRAARQADVIHANWAICGAIGGLVGKLTGVPVVTTLRGDDVTRAHRSWFDRTILALCLRLSRRIVCVSESIAAWTRSRYPQQAASISVIENGVEDVFLQVSAKRSAVGHERCNFVTVGSLIVRKGVDRIIAALGKLSGNTRLTIIGDGPEQSRLQELVDGAGLRERVEFTGAVPPQAIADRLAQADVFVLASRSEGRPNAVLEAMAAGLPVVASNIPGVDELIEHGTTGFLFNPDSVDNLARHMQALADAPELRRRLGSAGSDAIRRRGLLWRETAENYFRTYRALATKNT
ncbi:MAG: glycosyltransferase family 4 protein [Sulfurifustaceae bacterium]